MYLGKIVVKNNYEQKGDLVFRPLVRAYKKNGLECFVEEDKAILLGIVRDGIFYELFTWEPILYSNYELIDFDEFDSILNCLPIEKAGILKKTIVSFVFNKTEEYFFDSNSIEELAMDRAVEFDAYNRDLTDINPYQEPFDGYTDFEYKCKILEKNK